MIKVNNVWAKKYRGVIFDGTKDWCKIWMKNDLCFQKWHEKFSKFSPEHVRKSKNWDFDGIILSKVENVENILYHDSEEWYRIWRGIDLSVQNWHEEFDKCWLEHLKTSKMYTLICCFWPKYIMFELKKVMFDGTEDWCKIWR